jgi:hypothetical protein
MAATAMDISEPIPGAATAGVLFSVFNFISVDTHSLQRLSKEIMIRIRQLKKFITIDYLESDILCG